nr:hypothetical protein MIMGU_mgv1a024924mg [Ipomoea batatas]
MKQRRPSLEDDGGNRISAYLLVRQRQEQKRRRKCYSEYYIFRITEWEEIARNLCRRNLYEEGEEKLREFFVSYFLISFDYYTEVYESMAGEMSVAVVIGGEDTAAPKTTLSGGGVWSKVSRKVMNVMTFIRGLKSGRNRKEIPGSGGEEEKSPIVEMMEKQELGKAVFMLAVPMSTGLVLLKSDALSPTAVHFTLVANVAGCTAIWNGLLLRKTCSRIATVVEQAGVGSVFLGFNVLVGNYLPPELRFVPFICWGFSVLPFVMAAVPGGGGGGTVLQGGKEENICPV